VEARTRVEKKMFSSSRSDGGGGKKQRTMHHPHHHKHNNSTSISGASATTPACSSVWDSCMSVTNNGSTNTTTTVPSVKIGESNAKTFFGFQPLEDAQQCRRIIELVHSMSRTKETAKNKIPCQFPSTFDSQSLSVILETPYWVTEKTDGDRVMLLMTPTSSYLVNRNGDCFVLPLTNNSNNTNNTHSLFDGEVVVNYAGSVTPAHSRHLLLLFDCIVWEGMYVGDLPFSQRREHVASVCLSPAVLEFQDKLRILAKEFVPDYEIMKIISKICILAEGKIVYSDGVRLTKNDGIIFTAENSGAFDITRPMFKWKSKKKTTIDFRAKYPFYYHQQHNRLSLFVADPDGKDIECDIGEISDDRISQEFAQMIRDGNPQTCIVECLLNNTGVWQVEKIRRDKINPNPYYIAFKTLKTIASHIPLKRIETTLAQKPKWNTHLHVTQ
jgi:hypothetical protein